MYTVHLKKIKLFGRHGVHAAEQVVGGLFELDIDCSFQHEEIVTALNETVNYEALYRLVKKRFDQPYALLESLAAELAEDIYEAHPFLTGISVSIFKLNPPIESFSGQTGVTFTAQYP
jgi:7,8-dihydroneopterin aldolase/epimerase/oxygenase